MYSNARISRISSSLHLAASHHPQSPQAKSRRAVQGPPRKTSPCCRAHSQPYRPRKLCRHPASTSSQTLTSQTMRQHTSRHRVHASPTGPRSAACAAVSPGGSRKALQHDSKAALRPDRRNCWPRQLQPLHTAHDRCWSQQLDSAARGENGPMLWRQSCTTAQKLGGSLSAALGHDAHTRSPAHPLQAHPRCSSVVHRQCWQGSC